MWKSTVPQDIEHIVKSAVTPNIEDFKTSET